MFTVAYFNHRVLKITRQWLPSRARILKYTKRVVRCWLQRHKLDPKIWWCTEACKPEMAAWKMNTNVPSVCDHSSSVSYRVPEGEGRQQLLVDQKPLVLGEPAGCVLTQPAVLGGRARRQGDGEREEPDESVDFQRRLVVFRLQGEFLRPYLWVLWDDVS